MMLQTMHKGCVTALLIGTLACTGESQAPQLSPVTADSLQRVVDRRVAAGTPGLIVGVLGPDGERTIVAAGSARPGVPVTEHTIFEIGSITKAFTGVLLAEMVGRGEVTLDQAVAASLPSGTVVPSRNGIQITLGHLSTQTSGLPRLPNNIKPADVLNPYADYTVAQLYDFLAGHTLARDPGAQYEYSNLGVGLLGHALALGAGKSYEEVLRERVLTPLGMTNTGVVLTSAMQQQVAHGHTADGDAVPLWDIPTLAGAGALRSSMSDMLRFLAANLSPGSDALGAALASSHVPRFTVNSALSLGLNWHRSVMNGDTLIWHNGGTGGFRTIIAFSPRTRRGAVLLGNASIDNEDIVRHVLVGLPLTNVLVRREIALDPDVLSAYEGRYQLSPTFTITITREGNRIFAQPTGQPRFRLYAEARDRFFLKVVPAQLEFSRDSTGAVAFLTLVQNGARQPGRRLPE